VGFCGNDERRDFAFVIRFSYCYGVDKMVIMRKKYVTIKTFCVLFTLIHILRGPPMHRRLEIGISQSSAASTSKRKPFSGQHESFSYQLCISSQYI